MQSMWYWGADHVDVFWHTDDYEGRAGNGNYRRAAKEDTLIL